MSDNLRRLAYGIVLLIFVTSPIMIAVLFAWAFPRKAEQDVLPRKIQETRSCVTNYNGHLFNIVGKCQNCSIYIGEWKRIGPDVMKELRKEQ